jgi:hypothetical protein
VISFSKLGSFGRLGNQLFQYAFLRSTAVRLGTRFHCPAWIGDRVFQLDDAALRAAPQALPKTWRSALRDVGFEPDALRIEDGSEIQGFFQSARYFDAREVRRWYAFREEAVADVAARHAHVDFDDAVALHLRFGDKRGSARFYLPRPRFYLDALRDRIPPRRHILVFSDDRRRSRRYLSRLEGRAEFVAGNEPYEDLYLMSRCRDFIGSSSTLAWWGAWLDPRADKIVVVPAEGLFRPGVRTAATDYWPAGWIQVRGLSPLQGYRVARLRQLARGALRAH